MIFEPATKVSLRFGYIEFAEPETAEFILSKNDMVIHGFNVSCRRFGDSGDHNVKMRKRVVSNIISSQSALEAYSSLKETLDYQIEFGSDILAKLIISE